MGYNKSVPRTCGDEPTLVAAPGTGKACSPHVRG